MGDSYDRVQAVAVAEWRQGQAKIILELEDMLLLFLTPHQRRAYEPRWLHVLVEKGQGGEEVGEWEGRVNSLKKQVQWGVTELGGKLDQQASKATHMEDRVKELPRAVSQLLKEELKAVRSQHEKQLAQVLQENKDVQQHLVALQAQQAALQALVERLAAHLLKGQDQAHEPGGTRSTL
jgi:membrane-associated HD superfamily phosphohydrolase